MHGCHQLLVARELERIGAHVGNRWHEVRAPPLCARTWCRRPRTSPRSPGPPMDRSGQADLGTEVGAGEDQPEPVSKGSRNSVNHVVVRERPGWGGTRHHMVDPRVREFTG